MTSEILYTYIWRKEEVIKPHGPLPYSRKHSTNLLTWFIITLCNLAKPTLQLFERKNPAEKERERTYMGELWLREARVFLSVCGRIVQARPCWQHHAWVRGVQILQLGLWGFVTTRNTNGSVFSLHVYLWLCSDGRGEGWGAAGESIRSCSLSHGEPAPALSSILALCKEVEKGWGWAHAI